MIEAKLNLENIELEIDGESVSIWGNNMIFCEERLFIELSEIDKVINFLNKVKPGV